MSPLRKGVPARPAGGKTPHKLFFNHIPALKDRAIDTLYLIINADTYPDIYVGDEHAKINGIYAKLTFSEGTQ